MEGTDSDNLASLFRSIRSWVGLQEALALRSLRANAGIWPVCWGPDELEVGSGPALALGNVAVWVIGGGLAERSFACASLGGLAELHLDRFATIPS